MTSTARSFAPLPPDPEGLAALEEQISSLAESVRQPEIPTMPPMAAQISGKNYRLQGSRYNFDSFTLGVIDRMTGTQLQ